MCNNPNSTMAIKPHDSTTSNTSKSNSNTTPMNTAAMMMDWFDNHCGVDLLGCDESCATATQQVFTKALTTPSQLHKTKSQQQQQQQLAERHAEWHDELLEALLNEQIIAGAADDPEDVSSTTSTATASISMDSRSSSFSTSLSFQQEQQQHQQQQRKRRRPVRLTRRRTPPRLGGRAPLAKLDIDNTHATTTNTNTLSSSNSKTTTTANNNTNTTTNTTIRPTKPAAEYLHPHCRLQKDKGRGDAVGSAVCAKGRDLCLAKLRQKMRLLAEHASSPSGKATMKRRKARVAAKHANFWETRSVLELRMGFLSMQYGVLLRWDTATTTATTARVTLVVLRKMCHESFYPKQSLKFSSSSTAAASTLQHHHHHHNQVPIRREVIRREIRPGTLRIAAPTCTGLTSKRSSYTVQLAYEDALENFVLADDGSGTYRAVGQMLRHLPDTAKLGSLEIKLFQQRRRHQRRLVTSMRIPLKGVSAQSRLQLPLAAEDAVLQLELSVIKQEPLPEPPSPRRMVAVVEPETVVGEVPEDRQEENDPWEWICCVC